MNITAQLVSFLHQSKIFVNSSSEFVVVSVTLTLLVDFHGEIGVSTGNNRYLQLLQSQPNLLWHINDVDELCVEEIHNNLTTKTFFCPDSIPRVSETIAVWGLQPETVDKVSCFNYSVSKTQPMLLFGM